MLPATVKIPFNGFTCPDLGLDCLVTHHNLSNCDTEKPGGSEGGRGWSCLAFLLCFGNNPCKGAVCEGTAECQGVLVLSPELAVCLT